MFVLVVGDGGGGKARVCVRMEAVCFARLPRLYMQSTPQPINQSPFPTHLPTVQSQSSHHHHDDDQYPETTSFYPAMVVENNLKLPRPGDEGKRAEYHALLWFDEDEDEQGQPKLAKVKKKKERVVCMLDCLFVWLVGCCGRKMYQVVSSVEWWLIPKHNETTPIIGALAPHHRHPRRLPRRGPRLTPFHQPTLTPSHRAATRRRGVWMCGSVQVQVNRSIVGKRRIKQSIRLVLNHTAACVQFRSVSFYILTRAAPRSQLHQRINGTASQLLVPSYINRSSLPPRRFHHDPPYPCPKSEAARRRANRIQSRRTKGRTRTRSWMRKRRALRTRTKGRSDWNVSIEKKHIGVAFIVSCLLLLLLLVTIPNIVHFPSKPTSLIINRGGGHTGGRHGPTASATRARPHLAPPPPASACARRTGPRLPPPPRWPRRPSPCPRSGCSPASRRSPVCGACWGRGSVWAV